MSLNLAGSGENIVVDTINLSKIKTGVQVNLSKEHPTLSNLIFKLVWTGHVDLDASVALLDRSNKCHTRTMASLVSYMTLDAAGVHHFGDIRSGGTEEIAIDLAKLDSSVMSLAFSATTHEQHAPATLIREVQTAKAYVINATTKQAIYEFDLATNQVDATGLELARVNKIDNEWVLSIVEQKLGSKFMGLYGMVDKYLM